MSLTRRSLLSATVYGGFAVILSANSRAETPGVRATRILQSKPANGRREPPVITCLATQPGGNLVAVGGDDHLLRIWNVRTGEMVHTVAGHRDWIRAVQFVPGRDEIVTAGNDRRLLRWTLSAGGIAHREIARHDQVITSVALNSAGGRLAATGFEPRMSLYDLNAYRLVTHIDCPCRDMRTTAFSPDGDALASAGRKDKIRIGAVDDLKHVRDIEAHAQRIRALAFSPDGRHVASASEDRTARIWNIATGEPVAKLSTGSAKILSAVYLNDHHLATGGSDNMIRVWDVGQEELSDTLIGHTGSVTTLATNGTLLISGSFDTTVRVWHPLDEVNQADRRSGANETLH